MDLTSSKRALESLWRRQVPDTELTTAQAMLNILSEINISKLNEENLFLEHSLAVNATDVLLNVENIFKLISRLLSSNKWESRAAGYLFLADYIELIDSAQRDAILQLDYLRFFWGRIELDFEDIEPRLRSACVKALKPLGRYAGEDTWNRLGRKIIEAIQVNLKLDPSERVKTMQEMYDFELNAKPSDNAAVEQSSVLEFAINPPEGIRIAHETVGWKALETSLRALESIIEGCGDLFFDRQFLTDEIVDLVIDECLVHENRYVREVGYDLCTAIVTHLKEHETNTSEQTAFFDRFVVAVSRGLADNWSQVRYAASVSTRRLLLNLFEKQSSLVFTGEKLDAYLDILVPRMCLNRYYLAEGVKLYNQDSWKILFKDRGVDVLLARMPFVVDFYCEQCKADNHAVREAACYVIAELATKVFPSDSRLQVQKFVPLLLDSLVSCFHDDSWPVRDAACIATAQFVSKFPKECQTTIDDVLYELWFEHLSDNIWSVREDAALALGILMKTYSDSLAKVGAASAPSDNIVAQGVDTKLSKPVLGAFLKKYSPKNETPTSESKGIEIVSNEGKSEFGFNPIEKVIERLPKMLEAVFKEKKVNNQNTVNFIEFDFSDDVNSIKSGVLSEDSQEVQRYLTRKAKPRGVITGYISELPELNKFHQEAERKRADSTSSNPINDDQDHDHSGHQHNDENEVDNEDEDPLTKYMNQQMYSCGSLAPKLKRSRGVGCMDHGYARKKRPWEVTDGSIFLVRELAKADPDAAIKFMPTIAKIVIDARFFRDYEKIIESIWKNFPETAEYLGKKNFKSILSMFLEIMIKDLAHENKLISHSAHNCIVRVKNYLGAEVFNFRVNSLFQAEKLVDILAAKCPECA